MTQPRKRPSTVSLAALAFGPLLALAATLTLAPEAQAAPKTCSLKPAACQLEQHRAEQRGTSAAKPAAGTASVLCASKSAACQVQQRAAAEQTARSEASGTTAASQARPPVCNLKSAACFVQQRRDAR
jgi:hypothetical protein